MESLLRWGIENSDPQGQAQTSQVERKDIDPGVIDMILGKPDAELMKEALAVATDEKNSEDDRLQALDNFEMVCLNFVEHICQFTDEFLAHREHRQRKRLVYLKSQV